MTRAVFETATLADAIKKADRVAPTKGSAFDKAAGIVIAVDPEAGLVVVRATNLSIFSMEWVTALEVEGDAVSWRVPSKLFATVLAGLPIGTGKNVTLEEKSDGRNRMLHLTAGRTRAKFNLMQVDYYPEWEVFSPDGLVEVDDFGGRIGLVEWAAAKGDEPPLNGLHLDGEIVLACDRYRLATSPLIIPGLAEPITVPSGILGSILKQTGEIRMGVDAWGHLLIMPDDTTQIMTVTFGVEYPKVQRIMSRDNPSCVKVKKAPILEIMNRAKSFAGNDRFPLMRLFFGEQQVAVIMNTSEVGTLADVMETPGYCDHSFFEMKFTPSNIIDAIQACPNEEMSIWYDTDDAMRIVYIDGGSGYEAWIMPRKALSPEEIAEQEEARNATASAD